MATLLALLTGIALLALLVVIGLGLHLVTVSLRRTNATIAKISWGVRAIESETAMLPAHAPELIRTFAGLDGGAKVIADRLGSAERRLAAAGELLAKGGS